MLISRNDQVLIHYLGGIFRAKVFVAWSAVRNSVIWSVDMIVLFNKGRVFSESPE